MASQVLLLPQQQHHQTNPQKSNLQDALDSCSSLARLQQLHSQVIRLGLSSDNHTIGRIVKKLCLNQQQSHHHHHHHHYYLDYALQVFHRIPKPDVFLYNTIFNGYLVTTDINVDIRPANILLLYSKMLHCSLCPNHFTFPSLLRACCVPGAAEEGKQLHAHVFKFGHGDDAVSQNNLMHMYVNHGHPEKARQVFDRMPARDAVSWTTLISGYARWGRVDDARRLFLFEARHGMKKQPSAAWNAMIAAFVHSNRFQEAFALFARMRDEEEVALDEYVAATMLSACAALGALEQGEWIVGYIERSRMEADGKVATSIIDMYCKCGCLDKALQVFNALEEKGISSWNCIIGGLGLHGRPEAAMELFKEMERGRPAHPRPDAVTMVNVLTACAHAGLVAEGRRCFRHMIETYGMEPGLEHYGCMVDLLGRAGLVAEAKKLVQEMPMAPDAAVLGALLGACKIYGEVELGAEVGKQLLEMEPENSGRYVLLANLYASAGRWDDVAGVRKLMEERGVKKTPGWSVVQLDGSATQFIAGDPGSMEISCMVHDMLGRIKPAGYVPDVEEVLHDLQDKEDPLHYHSEKLAIAYGLLNTSAGATIRISKNLRVCKDCHTACKLISQVFDRKIVMRDRNRFHHFEGGTCSCMDFW